MSAGQTPSAPGPTAAELAAQVRQALIFLDTDYPCNCGHEALRDALSGLDDTGKEQP